MVCLYDATPREQIPSHCMRSAAHSMGSARSESEASRARITQSTTYCGLINTKAGGTSQGVGKDVHKARQKWARVIWKAPAFKTTLLSTVNQEMVRVCGLHFTLGWLSDTVLQILGECQSNNGSYNQDVITAWCMEPQRWACSESKCIKPMKDRPGILGFPELTI